jgi:hypothetical protein
MVVSNYLYLPILAFHLPSSSVVIIFLYLCLLGLHNLRHPVAWWLNWLCLFLSVPSTTCSYIIRPSSGGTVVLPGYVWTVYLKLVQGLKYFRQLKLLNINYYNLKCYLHHIVFPSYNIQGSLSQFIFINFILYITYWLSVGVDVFLQVCPLHVNGSFSVFGAKWSTCRVDVSDVIGIWVTKKNNLEL